MKIRTWIAAATAGVILTGCASFSPPKRSPYTGPDNVGAIEASGLVGVWEATTLNPLEDEPDQETIIEYRADGTVLGRIKSLAGSSDPIGNMEFEMTGDWSVAGELIEHTNVNMREVSGNQFAALLTSLINTRSRDLGGKSNVYEMSADRMVMVGADGAAIQYDRSR